MVLNEPYCNLWKFWQSYLSSSFAPWQSSQFSIWSRTNVRKVCVSNVIISEIKKINIIRTAFSIMSPSSGYIYPNNIENEFIDLKNLINHIHVVSNYILKSQTPPHSVVEVPQHSLMDQTGVKCIFSNLKTISHWESQFPFPINEGWIIRWVRKRKFEFFRRVGRFVAF